MVQRDFNSIETELGTASIENFLSRIENLAAPIIRRLIEAETSAILSDADKGTIALFVALQLIRGTSHRAQYLHLAKGLKEELARRGIPVDSQTLPIPDEDTLKALALRSIATELPEYAAPLRSKEMLVFKAARGSEFMIGDNPVVMDNHRDRGFRGNLGLTSRGVEVYLPLSKTLTLGLWSTDLTTELRQTLADTRKTLDHLGTLAMLGAPDVATQARRKLESVTPRIADAELLIRETEAGGPITTFPENMDRFNSMQVVYAERYLASAGGNFDLAKLMLSATPALREGGSRVVVS